LPARTSKPYDQHALSVLAVQAGRYDTATAGTVDVIVQRQRRVVVCTVRWCAVTGEAQ